jgi:hypothetical protein
MAKYISVSLSKHMTTEKFYSATRRFIATKKKKLIEFILSQWIHSPFTTELKLITAWYQLHFWFILVEMQTIFPTDLCGTDINYTNLHIHYVESAEANIDDSPT